MRESGAVPATVAIRDGRAPRRARQDDRSRALAKAPAGTVLKAARPSLAVALDGSGWAATTVSATMIAAHAAGITVFATGGIGGVHRGAGDSFDISSDLEELARTPMAVVCAGPKSILDVPATLEYLETRGVPVVAVGQEEVPGFYARSAGVKAPSSVPDVDAAARLVDAHLGLGLGRAILLCVPVPNGDALAAEVAERGRAASRSKMRMRLASRDAALTPWLLGRIAEITDGAAVRANTALIVNNARVAAELAARTRSSAAEVRRQLCAVRLISHTA